MLTYSQHSYTQERPFLSLGTQQCDFSVIQSFLEGKRKFITSSHTFLCHNVNRFTVKYTEETLNFIENHCVAAVVRTVIKSMWPLAELQNFSHRGERGAQVLFFTSWETCFPYRLAQHSVLQHQQINNDMTLNDRYYRNTFFCVCFKYNLSNLSQFLTWICKVHKFELCYFLLLSFQFRYRGCKMLQVTRGSFYNTAGH